jgi:pantoate--beta-alanine ligase
MGALHKGHISLINSSKKKCKKTLVSIFINPSQFNKKKDLKKYPKNFNKDLKILKKLKIDYLLIPKISEIYKSKKNIRININKKDKILCAKYRPGHFEGVLAVINQFLINIKPKFMFLGEKDFQQIILIQKFIKNKFKTKIIKCKTIRINNSLPCSSRNFLLSKNQLIKASFVSRTIFKFYLSIKKNFKNKININEVKRNIESKKIKIDYFELRNKINLSKNFNKNNFKIFVAYHLKNIRLIDNF